MTGYDLDRRLEAWMSTEAPRRAPDRVLTVALERVDGTAQRRGISSRLGLPAWRTLSRSRQVLLAAAALLLLGVVGIIGALLLRGLDPGPPAVVLVRGEDGSDQPAAILVIERQADGTETQLARFTAEQLGGLPQLWIGPPVLSSFDHLAVQIMRADGTYGYAVVDLRDPDALALMPDFSGDYPTFGPDGTLGLSMPEGLGMFDPFTGRSTTTGLTPVDGNAPTPATALDRLLSWASDGSGVLADRGMFLGQDDGTVVASAIGTLRRDGTFVEGTVPLEYDGVMARRVTPDGTLLRCAGGYDDCGAIEWDVYAVTSEGQDVVWDNPDTTRMISDFAWSADGGLWLLLETATPGPRTVTLMRVAPDGAETPVTTFDAAADDPDPNSYFQAAVFTGFAPDDSRIGIQVAGENGSAASQWLVDPTTGERAPIDGRIAGWRADDAVRARPDVARVAPTDPSMRGLWANAASAVRIGATRIAIGPSDAIVTGTIESSADVEVVVSGAMPELDCAADQVGRYGWSLEGDRLALQAIDDSCAERTAALTGSFDRALPDDMNGPPQVESGHTYRAAGFQPPLLVTIPAVDQLVQVSAFRPGTVSLMQSSPDGSSTAGVTVISATHAAADPCERFGQGEPLGATGVAGVFDYLDREGIAVANVDETTLDGRPATRFTIEPPAGCSEGYLSLFGAGPELGGVAADARLTVFATDDGTAVVIATSGESADPAAAAWEDAVVDGLRFGEP